VISWNGAGITSGSTYLRPWGIDVVGGDVYVSDAVEHVQPGDISAWGPLQPRVVKFDADGAYQAQWPLDFNYPTDLATDGASVYVVDWLHSKVKGYSSAGVHGSDFAVTDPVGVALGGGTVYATSESNSVFRFPPGTSWSTGNRPSGLAVAPNGDVWVARYEPGTIQRYSPSGSLLGGFDSMGAEDLAVDSSGDLYTSGDAVRRYSPDGTLVGTWNVRSEGIAVDSANRVYVTQPSRSSSPTGWVYRLDPSDEKPTAALTATPADPFATQLVTFDASASTPPTLGHITKYEWDLDGDGTYETHGGLSPTISRRFQQVSTETVRVRVSGSNGPSASKTITLGIAEPPTTMTVMPSLVATGDLVSFDASGSIIDRSQIERFEWDLDGNGSFETDTGTSPTTQRSYGSRRAITPALRVTRSGGRVDGATATLEVRLAPPPGELGVSINSGDFATNDRHVTLSPVWPRLAESALVSDDGGFGAAGSTQLVEVEPQIAWTLRSAGAERLPRTVYVRYRINGESQPGTYSDDIVLDEGSPVVTSARAAHRRLRVKAKDDNTGIRTLVVKKPGASRPFRTVAVGSVRAQARRQISAAVKLPRGVKRAYVRVIDVAGNRSRLRRVSFR
jgi:sugar lactone lactonase YvrE